MHICKYTNSPGIVTYLCKQIEPSLMSLWVISGWVISHYLVEVWSKTDQGVSKPYNWTIKQESINFDVKYKLSLFNFVNLPAYYYFCIKKWATTEITRKWPGFQTRKWNKVLLIKYSSLCSLWNFLCELCGYLFYHREHKGLHRD